MAKNFSVDNTVSRDFLLVWDWEKPYGELQGWEEYKIMAKIHSQALEYLKKGVGNCWDEATRVWNEITILDDLGEYTEASKRLPEAISCYATACRKEPRLDSQYTQTLLPSVVTETSHSHMNTWHGTEVLGGEYGRTLKSFAGEYGRTLISFAAGEGEKDIVSLLLDTVNPDLKDGNFGPTPLLWPARNGHEDVVKLLLETGKVDADSRSGCSQTPLFLAAKNGHETVVKLLLNTARVEADSKDLFSQTPLSCTAENRHEDVVKLLLKTRKVKADYVSGSG